MNKLNWRALLLCGLLLPATGAKAQHFGGTIVFRNGDKVEFTHLGATNNARQYYLVGKLGAKAVKFDLGELKEVALAENNRHYGPLAGDGGTVIILNKDEERFTLTEAGFLAEGFVGVPPLEYTYFDVVTKKQRTSRAVLRDNVMSISIGRNVGNIKLNSKTGEYFPPLFVFDPFTGDRLVWAEEKR
jgi:hypothetical protein